MVYIASYENQDKTVVDVRNALIKASKQNKKQLMSGILIESIRRHNGFIYGFTRINKLYKYIKPGWRLLQCFLIYIKNFQRTMTLKYP